MIIAGIVHGKKLMTKDYVLTQFYGNIGNWEIGSPHAVDKLAC